MYRTMSHVTDGSSTTVYDQCVAMRQCFCCRLKHNNIVELLDVFEDKTRVYLVMEL